MEKVYHEQCGQPLEAGEGKEMDFPLKPPERNTATHHLDFSPKRPISDF